MSLAFNDERFDTPSHAWDDEREANKGDAAKEKAIEAGKIITELAAEASSRAFNLQRPRPAHLGEEDPNRSEFDTGPGKGLHRAEQVPLPRFKDE